MKKILFFATLSLLISMGVAQNSMIDRDVNVNAIENQEILKTPIDRAPWGYELSYTFEAMLGAMVAIGTDGSNFYTANWQAGNGRFEKYDMNGSFLSNFTIPGVTEVRCFAYDGANFFVGAGTASSGNIRILDMATQTQIGTIPNTGGGCLRHLSYDPNLDGGNGGFWLGDWTTLRAISRSGTILHANSTVASVYGSAYDATSDPENPCLWLFAQPTYSASPFSSRCILQQWDIKTRTFTGVKYDTAVDFDYNPPGPDPQAQPGDIAGGAFGFVKDGKQYICANVQRTPNLILVYGPPCSPVPEVNVAYTANCKAEISWPSTGAASYKVFRGDQQLANITGTTYTDEGFDPMEGYTWGVKAVCEGGETDIITKTMPPCSTYPPVKIALTNEDGKLRVSWPTEKKVNVYRNDEIIAPEYTGTSYLDENPVSGNNCYTVEVVCEGEVSPMSDKECMVGINGFVSTFSIVPNPATDDIMITAKSSFNKVEIVNFLGQTVLSQSNDKDTAKVDISNLTNGIYFVRITSENGTGVQKFVKK
jgi:hypothetical protein